MRYLAVARRASGESSIPPAVVWAIVVLAIVTIAAVVFLFLGNALQ